MFGRTFGLQEALGKFKLLLLIVLIGGPHPTAIRSISFLPPFTVFSFFTFLVASPAGMT